MNDGADGSGQPAHLLYGNAVTWRDAEGYAAAAAEVLRAQPRDRLANYAMAAVCEFRGDMAAAVAHLERTGLRIGMDYDDYVLPSHRRVEEAYLAWSRAHPAAPACAVFSMPKTASTFVAECFHLMAGLPRVRVSKGSFVTGRVVPAWLATYRSCGGTLHDHVPPDRANVEALRQAPPPAVVLLVRDPVTASLSMIDYLLAERMDKYFARELGEVDLSYLRALPAATRRSVLFQKLLPRMTGWVDRWLQVAAAGEIPGCRFAVLRFEDLVRDGPGVLAAMERHFTGANRVFPPGSAETARQVAAIYAGLRDTKTTLMSAHRGRREVRLEASEQETVWRAIQHCPQLGRIYDLSLHLR